MANFKLYPLPIIGLANNRDRLDTPEFQRDPNIWTKKKESEFIDSILRGWKTPKLYFHLYSGKYWIIDGQQRIVTIFKFISDRVKTPKGSEPYSNMKFSELGEEWKKQFLGYNLDVEFITNASEADVTEIYFRLQQGTVLNLAEKLKGIRGKVRNFVDKLAKHQFFKNTNISERRFSINKLCAQITLLEISGIRDVKFKDLAKFYRNRRLSETNPKVKKIYKILDIWNKHSNKLAFLNKTGEVISFYLLCSKLEEKRLLGDNIDKIISFSDKFIQDVSNNSTLEQEKQELDLTEYSIASLQSTSGKASIETRQRVLLQHLCLEYPEFMPILDNMGRSALDSKINQKIAESVDCIFKTMRDCNIRRFSSGRSAVFNITNEHSIASRTLVKKINSENDYKNFIDALWKILYEASNCANNLGDLKKHRDHEVSTKELNVILKINDLRRPLFHDLEQGVGYEEKIRWAAEVISYYTGKGVLSDLSGTDYYKFQIRLLEDVKMYLQDYSSAK